METTVTRPQVQSAIPPVSSIIPASRSSRLLAAIVDTAAFLAIYLIAFVVGKPFVLFAGLAVLAVFQVYLLSSFGQTIGKKVMSIKIVKWDTEKNGGFVINVLVRMILNALISFVPLYALVDVLFIFREDRRCIHDMIAGTKVVEA